MTKTALKGHSFCHCYKFWIFQMLCFYQLSRFATCWSWGILAIKVYKNDRIPGIIKPGCKISKLFLLKIKMEEGLCSRADDWKKLADLKLLKKSLSWFSNIFSFHYSCSKVWELKSSDQITFTAVNFICYDVTLYQLIM